MEPTDRNRKAFDEAHKSSENVIPREGIPGPIRERLRDLTGQRVVHLGCGAGIETIELSQLGALVTGVDPDERLVEEARLRAPDLPWLVSPLDALPPEFLRNRSDLVYVGGSLGRVGDLGAWAGGIASALRPGGALLAYDDHPAALCLDAFSRWRDDYFEPRAGFRRLGEVLSAIGGAGLAVVRFEELPTLSPWRRQDPRVPAAFVLLAEKPERPHA